MGLNKGVDHLTESDLRELVERGEREGKSLDFKQEVIGKGDKDRKEFLADISSFANATGGYILFGVEEAGGAAVGLPGLSGIDTDKEIARLENMCRDGIDQRIPGLHMRAIPIEGGNSVIAIRIPRSWARLHMVTYQNSNKFYGRNSNGKYLLDVEEIQSCILASASLMDKVRRFRLERLSLIEAGETPVPILEGPAIAIHIVPIGFLDTTIAFDIEALVEAGFLNRRFRRNRINFDGLLYFSDFPRASEYLQVFRSGAIERVNSSILSFGQATIPSSAFEQQVLETVKESINSQIKLGVDLPIALMLTLSKVRGFRMAIRNELRALPETPIDRDNLLVPEVLIESFDGCIPEIVKEIVDPVWNACGYPKTPNFDDYGKRFLWGD